MALGFATTATHLNFGIWFSSTKQKALLGSWHEISCAYFRPHLQLSGCYQHNVENVVYHLSTEQHFMLS